MRRLSWTAQSRRDLYRINHWLAENADPETAAQIIDRIQDRATFLIDYPFAGARDGRDVRRLRVPSTAYLLLYRVPSDARVEILRVRHGREDRADGSAPS